MADIPVKVMQYEEQVAAALGTTLDAGISVDTIRLPIHAGAALYDLNKIYPGIDDIPEEITDADDNRTSNPLRFAADRAIINATALRVLPYWKLNYSKIDNLPGSKVEMFEPDWDALEARLQGEVDSALSELSPEYAEEIGSGFIGFRLTFSSGRHSPCTGT